MTVGLVQVMQGFCRAGVYLGYTKDSGDGVDSEDYVTQLDTDKDHKEGGGQATHLRNLDGETVSCDAARQAEAQVNHAIHRQARPCCDTWRIESGRGVHAWRCLFRDMGWISHK